MIKLLIIILIGIHSINVTPIPNIPDINPSINVSALNTCAISFLDAPTALKIPISLVLSRTLIYVTIPIIIEDTISEILEKKIKTIVIDSIIELVITDINFDSSV